jgi:futalosine hydrolase
MPILLCAATTFEIKPTIELIQRENIKNIEVLITGVGLTATTYQLTKAVYIKKPQLLLQAGVAGYLDKQYSLAQVVVIENECIGDMGVEENKKFNSLFDLKLNDRNVFPWTNGKLSNKIEILQQTNLPVANGVTINEISTNKERIQHYKNELGASIESMEGAALHYVGLMENIPFLQLRSLSNFAGERDKNKWLMKEAIVNLNTELQRMIFKLMHV